VPELRLGFEVIRSYKRLSYEPWSALAEFVDNSTQSYFNNRDALDSAYATEEALLVVSIRYDRNADELSISDNAMGMDEADLERALVVGAPPPDTSGRSRYGMGLKTAACWFGDLWTVTTSKLGSPEELTITVNVDDVASGNNDLPFERGPADPDAHYTIIEITRLNRALHGRTLGKIRDYLSSMYREDIETGLLRLVWQGQPLVWSSLEDTLQIGDHGKRLRRSFDFRVDSKRVHGWAGVLERGSRAKAGFSILHAGRVIKGWPESWRPQEIYGQVQGSNNLVNQRLVGEIHLDDFEVTHTKDDILWEGTEQEQVEATLRGAITDLIAIAAQPRGKRKRPPSRTAANEATNALGVEIRRHSPLPSTPRAGTASAALVALSPVLQRILTSAPDGLIDVWGERMSLYFSMDLKPGDPYVVLSDDHRSAIFNLNHAAAPHGLDGQALLQFLRSSLLDALTSRAVANGGVDDVATSVLLVKDQLLRVWANGDA
jgi:hypothetical protein